MNRTQRKNAAHRASVTGNTVAGVTGSAFGAAKLRDLHVKQYGDQHVKALTRRTYKVVRTARPAHPVQAARIASSVMHGSPGFKTAVVGATAGGLAAGTRRLEAHIERKERMGKCFGVEISKLRESPETRQKFPLKERVRQAKQPPPVRMKRVASSTALHSQGYQPQTRRMEVTFNGRPDRRYTYRMKPKAAKAFLDAPSKGHHYATKVKGNYRHSGRTRPSDRARLFAQPVSKSRVVFGVDVGPRP